MTNSLSALSSYRKVVPTVRVPGKTWKTVMDTWNSLSPLREEDRHLTTFITPFGRWWYARAPQGYASSGDGYNRRFNVILSEFERKESIRAEGDHQGNPVVEDPEPLATNSDKPHKLYGWERTASSEMA